MIFAHKQRRNKMKISYKGSFNILIKLTAPDFGSAVFSNLYFSFANKTFITKISFIFAFASLNIISITRARQWYKVYARYLQNKVHFVQLLAET